MVVLVALVLLPAAIEVSAPGCVDLETVVAAVDAVGGVDVIENVRVVVEDDAAGGARLRIDLELIGVSPLHREAPLLPVECADVADLTAFLVKSQREQAGATRALSTAPAPDPQPPRAQRAPPRDGRRHSEAWGVCDGPPTCGGGVRSSASFGFGMPTISRFALDIGFDLDEHLTPTATLEYGAAGRAVLYGGLMARALLGDVVEVSARGSVGVGGGLPYIGGPTWTVAPQAALRARVGYVFVDVGGVWHLNLDPTPGAFVAVGVAMTGP